MQSYNLLHHAGQLSGPWTRAYSRIILISIWRHHRRPRAFKVLCEEVGPVTSQMLTDRDLNPVSDAACSLAGPDDVASLKSMSSPNSS